MPRHCFCGCGLRLGGLLNARRSANGMGQSVAATLALLEGAGADRTLVEGLLQAGRVHVDACRAVVHGERSSRDLDPEAIQRWIGDAQGAAGFFRLERLERRAS